MARSTPLTTGIRSAPTTEMYTRCLALNVDAARTRFRVLSSSPLRLPAQCTMVPTPSTAAPIPLPAARSPVTNSMPSAASWCLRLSTRTSQPASRRRGTTSRPSVPVPPVTRMGDVMAGLFIRDCMISLRSWSSGVFALNWRGERPRVSILISFSHRDLLSHRQGFFRHYYDGTRQKDVTDGRERISGKAIRGAQKPPEGGGLPDARLPFRGGRCRPGSLAASQPLRDERRREPGRMADHGRRTSVPGHAALAHLAACGAPGRAPRDARARAASESRGWDRPRARSTSGRLGRAGATRGTPNALSRRATRVRTARYVLDAF